MENFLSKSQSVQNRIKRIMQSNEDVGKVAAGSTYLVGMFILYLMLCLGEFPHEVGAFDCLQLAFWTGSLRTFSREQLRKPLVGELRRYQLLICT